MTVPAALERIREDRPITIKDDKGSTSRCIADIVQLFITIMDQLKLEIRAVDEVRANDFFITLQYARFSAIAQRTRPA